MATPSFLGIPLELRLRIYEFVFADAEIHLCSDTENFFRWKPLLWEPRAEVLATSTRVRNEALSTYKIKLTATANHNSTYRGVWPLSNTISNAVSELTISKQLIVGLEDLTDTFPNLKHMVVDIYFKQQTRRAQHMASNNDRIKQAKQGAYDHTMMNVAQHYHRREYDKLLAAVEQGVEVFLRARAIFVHNQDQRRSTTTILWRVPNNEVIARHWQDHDGPAPEATGEQCLMQQKGCRLCAGD